MGAARAGLLIVLAGTACGPHSERGPRSDSPLGGVLMLHVENHQWPDMDVYVAGGVGAPQVVGIVRGKSEQRFELSRALFRGTHEVRLIAKPFGTTQELVSDPLDIRDRTARWRLNRSGSTRLLTM